MTNLEKFDEIIKCKNRLLELMPNALYCTFEKIRGDIDTALVETGIMDAETGIIEPDRDNE